MTSAPPESTTPVPPSLATRCLRWVKANPTLHAVVVVLLSLAVIVASISGVVSRRQLERRASAQQDELLRSTTATLAGQASALLRLTALPLGWAFRSALLKDDLAAIDTYLRRMVQEPHVTDVALVGTDGVISHASDQKLQGRLAQKAFPEVALDGQSPASVVTGHEVRIVVPIMGYDRRLGTLVFSYALPELPKDRT
ncbi:MAG TPA: hypothetical protein VGP07_03920 [Polyangia bacterium]|jgi:uncharacterized membrane protein affecting hemolysin expression